MPGLIDQWSRICSIAERILKRSEASAVSHFVDPLEILLAKANHSVLGRSIKNDDDNQYSD